MARLFISYARSDGADLAEHLGLVLRTRRHAVFLDDRSIPPGARWRSVLDQEIRECDACLVVLTRGAFDSPEVESEWNEALSRKKPVCGLLAPDVTADSVPSRLKVTNLVSGEHQDAAFAQIELWLKGLVPPGPDLRAQPDALATPAGPAPADAPPALVGDWPWNVKGELRGRDAETDALRNALADPKASMVTVVGRAGIGKTALVCKVLHALQTGARRTGDAARRVDGIALVGSRTGGVSLDHLMARCGELLGERGRKIDVATSLTVEEKIARLLDALAGGSYVILIDHLDDQLDERNRLKDPALQSCLEMFLRYPLSVCVVLTCREPVMLPPAAAPFVRQVSLDGLDDRAGAEVLRDLDATETRGLRNAPPDRLAEASRRLHGIPRALVLFAGWLLEDQFFDWHAWIDSKGPGGAAGGRTEEFLDELIRESYGRLTSDGRRVLQALSVFREPVSTDAVRAVLEGAVADADLTRILQRFARARTIQLEPSAPAGTDPGARHRGPRFSLHPTDQDYAYRQLDEDGAWSRAELERRAAAYYRDVREPRERWRTREGIEPLLFEFDHLVRAEAFDEAAALLDLIELDYLVLAGRAQKAQEMHLRLEGHLTEPAALARQLLGLGRAEIHLGSIAAGRERLQRARTLARECGEQTTEAESIGWLGESARRLGRMEEALACTSEAVRLSEAAGQPARAGRWLGEVSLMHCYRGQLAEALAAGRQALQITTEHGQAEWIALAQDALALVWLCAGRPAAALEYATQALATYAGSSWAPTAMYVMNVAALAHAQEGRFAEAAAELERAREMAENHHDVRVQGLVQFNTARLAHGRRDAASASAALSRAIEIFDRVQAAERVAARALAAALDAEERRDDRGRAAALLECAEASITCPDLLEPTDLLDDVALAARRMADADLEQKARILWDRIRAIRRSIDAAPATP